MTTDRDPIWPSPACAHKWDLYDGYPEKLTYRCNVCGIQCDIYSSRTPAPAPVGDVDLDKIEHAIDTLLSVDFLDEAGTCNKLSDIYNTLKNVLRFAKREACRAYLQQGKSQ